MRTWAHEGERVIPVNVIIEVFDEDQRHVLTEGPNSKAKVEIELILWLLLVLLLVLSTCWGVNLSNLCSGEF